MADNIIIKITTEADLDAAQKQLQALTDKMKQQEKAARDLSDQEKADAETIRQTVAIRERQKKALAENQRYYREEKEALKEQAKATKASIKELEKQIKGYKTFTGQSGRMVQQLRAMREELQRMEDSGQFGTKAFMDLAVAAGKLEDQIGDTQQRIRILSSDTLGLDAAMSAADGLSGAFYVATSAAEVFGSDLEGLQEAFYRVQAAMSVVSGAQQIAKTINKDSEILVVAQAAAANLRARAEAKVAAATAASTAATGAQTIVTKLATKAQIGLNTAIAASPLGWLIGIIAVAVAAVAGLAFGVYKLWEAFSDRGQAMKKFRDASKELEKIQAANAAGQAIRAHQQQELLRKQSDAHEKEMREAEARNASEIEMAQISLRHAKEKHDAVAKYSEEEIKRNQKEIDKLAEMVEAKRALVDTYRDGSNKQKKALLELAEVEQQYADALQKTADLETERQDAWESEQQSAQALIEARKQIRLQVEQANIDLMREGSEKEIAQIKLNYREQLKVIKGNSEEEIKLRKALLKKQAKEIAEVRNRYEIDHLKVRVSDINNLIGLDRDQLGQYFDEEQMQRELKRMKNIVTRERNIEMKELKASYEAGLINKEKYDAERIRIELEYQNRKRGIEEEELNRQIENQKRSQEILVKNAENIANELTGEESIEIQKKVWNTYYNEREKQLNEEARLEKSLVDASVDTAEVKAEKKKLIEAQLQADLEALRKEGAEKEIEIDSQYLDKLQRNVEKAERAVDASQGGGKLQALKERLDAEQDLYQAQQDQLQAQYDAGLITFQEYKNQEWEITKATADAEAQYVQDKMQTIADGLTTALGYIQEISDMVFDALASNVQAQMDALDDMYTTDAEEAKESATKRYISEKELADKKAALEMKQAKYAKAQALINAGINTALAITSALTTVPFPAGIAMAAIAATMGAAQIGIIASKPLAQYEKGRKGGKGEYALVGEKGPEIMYVPSGASIVPNHYLGDMDAWSKFGVPALPNEMMAAAMVQQINIDYDRLGRAVAANIPPQKAVSVNVDRNGVTINDNGNRRTYLNHKYTGAWS